MLDLSGYLELSTFMCHMLSDEPDSKALRSRLDTLRDPVEIESARDFALLSARLTADSADDSVHLVNQPEFFVSALGELDHERLHYWQLLTYPILQLNLLYKMEKVRCEVAEVPGGDPSLLAGLTTGGAVAPSAYVDILRARLLGQLDASRGEVELEQSDEDGLAEQELHYGIVSGGGPGSETHYVGWTYHSSSGFVGRVHFDVRHLTEAMASVTEALSSDHQPLVEANSSEDLLYWGAWLYFRRFFAQEEYTVRELMRLFLAILDCALMGDCAMVHDHRESSDSLEQYFREVSVGARFKLLVDLGPPPEVQNQVRDDEWLGGYQWYVSRQLGWPPPTEVAGRQMLRLTRIVGAYLGSLHDEREDVVEARSAHGRLLRVDVRDWLGHMEDIGRVWASLNAGLREWRFGFVGFRSISMMINALASRVGESRWYPDLVSRPRDLAHRFRLPLIKLGDEYFPDTPVPGKSLHFDHPIDATPMDVGTDALRLAVLSPIAEPREPGRVDHSQCGLIDRSTGVASCFYTSISLGCPGKGLTDQERARREQYELADFCHYTVASVRLHIAPDEVARRWHKRWTDTHTYVSDLPSIEDLFGDRDGTSRE
ncbi:hypothetical protein Acsp06_56540 [Actinomycetospora sp. NBRC 106375]|nr:hypothetical protein Acsp06_56540 [Actinomycetospora sp. NBRC 106375]